MTNKPEPPKGRKGRSGMRDQRRNLNPHKPARIAMVLWDFDYAYTQSGGSMDFWDKLSDAKKNICREIVQELAQAPDEVTP